MSFNNTEYQRAWRLRNPGKAEAYSRTSYLRRFDKIRDAALRKNYGISSADYDELLRRQNGVCAICLRPPNKYRLSVDHNHTGTDKRVRGLLCKRCNQGIGLFWDDYLVLLRASNYLEKAAIDNG